MRLPKAPPDINIIFKNGIAPEIWSRLTSMTPVDDKGRYLHWDDFRFRHPPDGLTIEEAWLGVHLVRRTSAVNTPFQDAKGASFWFTEPDPVRRALHEIDGLARGQIKIEDRVINEETRDAYVVRSLIEEAFSSSVIEGAATTREIAKEMVSKRRDPQSRSERMVLNNYRAMDFIKKVRGQDLTTEIILEIQRLVTQNAIDKPDQSGRFRRSDEVIQVTDQFEDVLHDPPPADEVSERMRQLCDFANRNTAQSPFISPVIKAIIIHFMIGYIHPFADGNGRTARALFYWSVLRDQYWLLEYISISEFIAQSKMQYGRAYLHSETDQGDLTYFIIYHIDVILQALRDLQDYLVQRMKDTESLETVLKGTVFEKAFNARQLELLRYAVQHPGAELTIRRHEALSRVSYQTARADLEMFAQKALLTKTRSGRETVYVVPKALMKKLK